MESGRISLVNILVIFCVIVFLFDAAAGYIVTQRNLPQLLFSLNITPSASNDDKQILEGLQKKSSENEYNALLEKGKKLGKKTSVIEIGNCSPYPRIVTVTLNAPLTFANSDSRQHILIFSPYKKLVLSPHTETTVAMDYYLITPTINGYGCDYQHGLVGALIVTSQQ
jgi:hypothetical protein